MAIGGFNGTDPAPTLAQFEKLVSEHKIHYFVGQNQASFGGGTGDAAQITSWVEEGFTSQVRPAALLSPGVNDHDLALDAGIIITRRESLSAGARQPHADRRGNRSTS